MNKELKKKLGEYRVDNALPNKYNSKYEIWKKNKQYGYYNFICYSDDNSEEFLLSLIKKERGK